MDAASERATSATAAQRSPGHDAEHGVRLSACVIARDEAGNLPDCLASVAFCDEIVVVDSGSVDATVALALAAGARVVHQDWLGFPGQRNVALDHARGDWVLEIDADERVTPELRREIEAFVATAPDDVDLAGLPLRDELVGRPLGPSAKYPKYRHRLLRRGAHRHDELRTVHEGLIPHGRVHPFTGDLRHVLAASWREAVTDAWRYARLEADQLTAPRSPAAVVKGVVVRPAAKLAYRTVVDAGWRDGWPGLVKIGLDCGTDAVVWGRYAVGAHGRDGRSGVLGELHYGAWKWRRGSVRAAVVAYGERNARTASAWTRAASDDGLDVVLLSDQAPAPGRPPSRMLRSTGPMSLARALDVEEQLRPIDVVLPVGRHARMLVRAVPRSLRGAHPAPPGPRLVAPAALAVAALAARSSAVPGD